jgi:hypothetical protein
VARFSSKPGTDETATVATTDDPTSEKIDGRTNRDCLHCVYLRTLIEVLARWKYETESDEEREETLKAIRRGLADVEAGRVMPAREAVAELRRKHNLPDLSGSMDRHCNAKRFPVSGSCIHP